MNGGDDLLSRPPLVGGGKLDGAATAVGPSDAGSPRHIVTGGRRRGIKGRHMGSPIPAMGVPLPRSDGGTWGGNPRGDPPSHTSLRQRGCVGPAGVPTISLRAMRGTTSGTACRRIEGAKPPPHRGDIL